MKENIGYIAGLLLVAGSIILAASFIVGGVIK